MAKRSNVMFEEIRIEMARRNIGVQEVAQIAGCNRDTMSKKLSGTGRLYLGEAMAIGDALFPGRDIRTVFKELYQRGRDSA